MVKAANRVREYHPRAAHKEGCACAPCIAKRRGAAPAAPPPAPEPVVPATCLLGTLNTKDMFTIGKQMYRVGNKTEDVCICAMLRWVRNGTDAFDQYWGLIKTVSMDLNTVVTPSDGAAPA